MRLRPAPLLLLALIGCARDHAPAWALQHGTLSLSEDGQTVTGVQVWEFFTRAWGRSLDEDAHVCARLQALTGAAVSVDENLCLDCEAIFNLELEEVETDCSGPVGESDAFLGPTRLAVGSVPPGLSEDDPYPGDSLGWYADWGDGALAPTGYLWPEALELDAGRVPRGWVAGERYVFWPDLAWQL